MKWKRIHGDKKKVLVKLGGVDEQATEMETFSAMRQSRARKRTKPKGVDTGRSSKMDGEIMDGEMDGLKQSKNQ